MIDVHTKLVGLIGNPIGHSLSPLMHNKHFESLQMNWYYLPIECDEKDLYKVMQGVRGMNFIGLNITKPYKIKILSYLDKVDSLAEEIGAVNTVVKSGDELIGYNTDGEGLYRDFIEQGYGKDGKDHILLMGAGGAGRACGLTFAKKGNCAIDIVDCIDSRAKDLSECCHKYVDSNWISYNRFLSMDLRDYSHLINATAAGMPGRLEESPVSQNQLYAHHILWDLTYAPKKTKFLKQGEKLGCKVYNGLGMVAYQGIKAFQIWSGKEGNIDVLFQVLRSM